MAIRSWLQQMVRRQNAAQPDKATAANAGPKTRPTRDEAIAYAVSLSGLVNDQPGTLEFYRATFGDHPERFVTYDDLRKKGDLLDKESLKALGLRANVKLSVQFLDTLNAQGRADPLGAASVIGLAVSTALCTLRDLAKIEAAGMDSAKLLASNMAAGPCGSAAKMDGQTMPIGDCPILPLKRCSHPGQCGCLYQARFALMDNL